MRDVFDCSYEGLRGGVSKIKYLSWTSMDELCAAVLKKGKQGERAKLLNKDAEDNLRKIDCKQCKTCRERIAVR